MTLLRYVSLSQNKTAPLISLVPYSFAIITPFIVYAIILVIPIPGEVGLTFRYGIGTVLASVALLVYPAYFLRGWSGTLASLTLTLVLFGLPLSGLWNSGTSVDSTVIGGLLPWSDALRYLYGPLQILDGGELTGSAAARPLFPGFVTFILMLTQQNVQATLAIIVAVTAVAAFLFTREIQRSKGTTIAVFALCIVFLYYRRFTGTFLTESLGLTFGLLAFTAMWRSAIEKKVWTFLLGSFLITLALCTRPAAIFVIPVIAGWGLWNFKDQLKSAFQLLPLFVGVVLIALSINLSTTRLIGSAPEKDSAGLAATLYGTIVGAHARQLQRDYPEAADSEYPRIIWETFQQNPTKLFTFITNGYREYFNINQNAFGYGFIVNDDKNPLAQRFRQLLFVLSFGGLVVCFLRRKDHEYSLILTLTLGVLLSIPALQAHSSDNLRHHAATIPITALLVAISLQPITRRVSTIFLEDVRINRGSTLRSTRTIYVAAIVLTISCTIAPLIISLTTVTPKFDPGFSCNEGINPSYLYTNSHSLIELVDNNSITHTRLPDVRLADFQAGLKKMGTLLDRNIYLELMNLTAGTTILIDRSGWLIDKNQRIPTENNTIIVCETRRTSELRYVDRVSIVSARKR